MEKEVFLIYFDILGFEKVPEKIEKKRKIESRGARDTFIKIIKEKMDSIKIEFKILGDCEVSRDSWLIALESKDNFNPIDKCFKIISKILNHHTPYKIPYNKIPIEFVVDIKRYDKWARFDGINLANEDATIEFLKENSINAYPTWYKMHHNKSIKKSFIVLTGAIFEKLNHFDKGLCSRFVLNNKSFYSINELNVLHINNKLDFLKKVRRPKDPWYREIDKLFVPPIEYDEIKKTLLKNNIVFITGPPGYGKTFTAIRLLWDFFNKGYFPKWYSEKRKKEKFVETINESKSKQILFFEDFFGENYQYERHKDLERDIESIISTINQKVEVYVIVTSTKDLFTQFEREKNSGLDLRIFEIQLRMGKPSYDFSSRKNILLNHARIQGCIWLNDPLLTNFIIKSIEDNDNNLPTPNSMKSFTTSTKQVVDEIELQNQIKLKSDESIKPLKKEIENLYLDRQIFLSLVYIFEHDFTNAVIKIFKNFYQNLLEKLEVRNPLDFQESLKELSVNDRIEIIPYYDTKIITFTRSSYRDAVKDFLFKTKTFRSTFEKIIFYLLRHKIGKIYVANLLSEDFDNLSSKIKYKNFLILSEDNKYLSYFGDFEEDIFHFLDLPHDIKVRVLLNFSKIYGRSTVPYRLIVTYFEFIPENISYKILFRISEVLDAYDFEEIITKCNFFYEEKAFRNKFLLRLARDPERAPSIINIVEKFYEEIPKDIRIKILKYFVDNEIEESCELIVKMLEKEYNEFPKYIREELIQGLSELDLDETCAAQLFKLCLDHFNRLSKNLRHVLSINFKRFDKYF